MYVKENDLDISIGHLGCLTIIAIKRFIGKYLEMLNTSWTLGINFIYFKAKTTHNSISKQIRIPKVL